MGASDVIIQTYVTAGLKWHYTRKKKKTKKTFIMSE